MRSNSLPTKQILLRSISLDLCVFQHAILIYRSYSLSIFWVYSDGFCHQLLTVANMFYQNNSWYFNSRQLPRGGLRSRSLRQPADGLPMWVPGGLHGRALYAAGVYWGCDVHERWTLLVSHYDVIRCQNNTIGIASSLFYLTKTQMSIDFMREVSRVRVFQPEWM